MGIRINHDVKTGYTPIQKYVIADNYIFDDQTVPTQVYGIAEENSSGVDNNFIHNNTIWGNTTEPIHKRGASVTVIGLNNLDRVYTHTSPLTLSNYAELTAISTPSSPATGFIRQYVKTIDSNNDGIFELRRLGGSVVEVQVGS